MDLSNMLKNLVPITLFNKGKASQLFSKVKNGAPLIVVKNNSPIAVVISPEEYLLLYDLAKTCKRDIEKNDTISSIKTIKSLVKEINTFDEGD